MNKNTPENLPFPSKSLLILQSAFKEGRLSKEEVETLSKQPSAKAEGFLMLDIYNRDYHNLSLQSAIYCTAIAVNIPTVYIDQYFLGLTPDTASAETICPDVLLASSRRKSCRGLYRLCNILTREQHFIPALKD